MTDMDIIFLEHCKQHGLIAAPFLEVGSSKVQGYMPNICELVRPHVPAEAKIVGVDMEPGDGVDLIQDFSLPPHQFDAEWQHGTFATVAIFNVLEHTYDPITVLRNAAACVAPGGRLIVASPVVWPLHDYPKDYVRLLPHWFEQFGPRHGLSIIDECFCWMSYFGITNVHSLVQGSQYDMPTYLNLGRQRNPRRYWMTKIVNRALNTFSRSYWFGHVALGVAFQKPQ